MTEQRRREIETECATRIVNAANARGGILKCAENVELKGDVKNLYESACKEANKFADEKGNVDPRVQTIFARMYGLI